MLSKDEIEAIVAPIIEPLPYHIGYGDYAKDFRVSVFANENDQEFEKVALTLTATNEQLDDKIQRQQVIEQWKSALREKGGVDAATWGR